MIRHAPLKPGKPLRRGKPLARSSSALKTVTTLKRSAPKHAAPRDTGPGRKTRLLVLERDGWCCAACGVSVISQQYSLQHRKARGVGGDNSPCNLVVLCGSATSPGGCHLRAEQRDPHMNGAGFQLFSWQDPRLEPVMLNGCDGGVTVWLSEDGRYSTEAPKGAAA